jgi:hypothetical protein
MEPASLLANDEKDADAAAPPVHDADEIAAVLDKRCVRLSIVGEEETAPFCRRRSTGAARDSGVGLCFDEECKE